MYNSNNFKLKFKNYKLKLKLFNINLFSFAPIFANQTKILAEFLHCPNGCHCTKTT